MTAAAATFQDLISSDGRAFAAGDGRRIIRALVRGFGIGLGGTFAVGGVIATALVAALWIVHATLATNPHAKTGFRATAVAVAERGPIDTAHLADLPVTPPVEEKPDRRLIAQMFEPEPALATAAAFAMSDTEIAARHDEPAVAAAPPPPISKPQEIAQDAEPAPLPRVRPADRAPSRPPRGEDTAKIAMATPPRAGADERAPKPRSEKAASLPSPDSRTAVYDISARTVYLPNGERLEAHSGLGDKMDDPRYVHVRMRGPTPPNVYDLKLREQLFHGVQAVRLNPVDQSKMFGRDGMLAHTYMLGPNGQSNGCVSFRNYPRFLRAVTRGEVDRLVVVARLSNASWRTVSGPSEPHRHYADITP
jgi:hypothetical protein